MGWTAVSPCSRLGFGVRAFVALMVAVSWYPPECVVNSGVALLQCFETAEQTVDEVMCWVRLTVLVGEEARGVVSCAGGFTYA